MEEKRDMVKHDICVRHSLRICSYCEYVIKNYLEFENHLLDHHRKELTIFEIKKLKGLV